MKKLIKAAVVVGLLGLSAGANASVINVGGVNWDPDAVNDFSAFSLGIHQDIDAVTGVVSGYGYVNTVNTTVPGVFCPGCELTFVFSGLTPVGSTPLPSAGLAINYTGGTVQFYVDSTPENSSGAPIGTLTAANASDGDLWLSLLFHVQPSGFTFLGTTFADGLTQTGSGLWDVIGGAAAGNFNTNTKLFGSDLTFSTSFTEVASNLLSADGTGNMRGNTIPEPGSLALLGLGLLGFGVARRKA